MNDKKQNRYYGKRKDKRREGGEGREGWEGGRIKKRRIKKKK